MTPGFPAALRRLEGQWRNLFRRIRTGFGDSREKPARSCYRG